MQIFRLGGNTVIRYGNIWDGRSPALGKSGSLFIRDGLIASPGPAVPGAPELNLSHCTIIPALLDCHTHLSLPPVPSLDDRAEQFLASGVAAVRDAGAPVHAPHPQSPLTVVPTISAISRTGFYGFALGTPVANISEAEGIVDFLALSGARQIKVIASGIFSFSSYGETGPLPFSVTELRVIVERARLHGLKVMAHASGDEAVRRCLRAGVHSIEHGYFASYSTIRELSLAGIAWVPTLSPVAAQLSVPELFLRLTAVQADVIRRSLETHRELVARAAAAGVTIGAGTDAGAPGVPHGISLVKELLLLHECGLTAVQALQTATFNAAFICGLEDKFGTIEPGKRAFILAVKGNPLTDPAVLQNPCCLVLPL